MHCLVCSRQDKNVNCLPFQKHKEITEPLVAHTPVAAPGDPPHPDRVSREDKEVDLEHRGVHGDRHSQQGHPQAEPLDLAALSQVKLPPVRVPGLHGWARVLEAHDVAQEAARGGHGEGELAQGPVPVNGPQARRLEAHRQGHHGRLHRGAQTGPRALRTAPWTHEVRTRGRAGRAGPTHLMEVQQKKGEHQDSFLHLAKPSSGSTEYKAGSHNCDEDDTTPCTVSVC